MREGDRNAHIVRSCTRDSVSRHGPKNDDDVDGGGGDDDDDDGDDDDSGGADDDRLVSDRGHNWSPKPDVWYSRSRKEQETWKFGSATAQVEFQWK